MNQYNYANNDKIIADIFLTDDGCTDGTPAAVRESIKGINVYVVQGDGNLYWAGGMRAAWNAALKSRGYDYYLLINDDTFIYNNALTTLFETEKYCLDTYKRKGIYSGITCAPDNKLTITYGGDVWVNRAKAISKRLGPSDKPQLCDMTNANILLIPNEVVGEIGIFYEGYQHGIADYDYSIQARDRGVPVLITADICGECENDHATKEETRNKICSMSFKERVKYFKSPLHSNKDYLTFIKRCAPKRYWMVYIGRTLNSYFPKFYYWLEDHLRRR